MGGYSLLARNYGIGVAERMLASGETYSGKKLYEMGIVHRLGKPGRGIECVGKFMRQHHQLGNGHRALMEVRQRHEPLDYNELADITELWVDAALRLEEKDLRLIDKLVKAQSRRMAKQNVKSFARTKQDRRFLKDQAAFPLLDWSGKNIMFDRRLFH